MYNYLYYSDVKITAIYSVMYIKNNKWIFRNIWVLAARKME